MLQSKGLATAAAILSLTSFSPKLRANDDYGNDFSRNTNSESSLVVEHAGAGISSKPTVGLNSPLKDCLPPAYDGPINWESRSQVKRVLAAGTLGSIAGASIAAFVASVSNSYLNKPDENKAKAGMLGFLAGGILGAGVQIAVAPSTIEYTTNIASVERSMPEYFETIKIRGKTPFSYRVGPYYPQIVTLPELDFSLVANPIGAPFVAGQKVKVLFQIGEDNRIISWTANQISPQIVAEQKAEKPKEHQSADQIRKQIVLNQLTLLLKNHDLTYSNKGELDAALKSGEKDKALTLSEKLKTYEIDKKETTQDLLAHFKDLTLKDKIDVIKNIVVPAALKAVDSAEAAKAKNDKNELNRNLATAHHWRGILDKLNEIREEPLRSPDKADQLRQQIKETEEAIKKLRQEMLLKGALDPKRLV